jgi:hypothetical protein
MVTLAQTYNPLSQEDARMEPRTTIPTPLQAPSSLDRMLDGIVRAVERVMDRPSGKKNAAAEVSEPGRRIA